MRKRSLTRLELARLLESTADRIRRAQLTYSTAEINLSAEIAERHDPLATFQMRLPTTKVKFDIRLTGEYDTKPRRGTRGRAKRKRGRR